MDLCSAALVCMIPEVGEASAPSGTSGTQHVGTLNIQAFGAMPHESHLFLEPVTLVWCEEPFEMICPWLLSQL